MVCFFQICSKQPFHNVLLVNISPYLHLRLQFCIPLSSIKKRGGGGRKEQDEQEFC